jgi:hypothetical protein
MPIVGAFVGGAVGLFLAKDEMAEPELFRILLAACRCGTTPRRRWVLLVSVFGLAGLPGAASAQRPDDRAQFDARMNMLERSVADLSIQIERLKVSDQELKRKLDAMRTNYDDRLERLEKGAAAKTPTPRRSNP